MAGSHGAGNTGQPGGSGNMPSGFGDRTHGGAGGEKAADQSEAGESPPTPDQNLGDNVAPANQPQSDLVLRKLQDVIKNDQVTPEMLQDLGMSSKEELNQFVEKFGGAPKRPTGEGREIEVKPGQSKPVVPDRPLPDLNPGSTISSQTVRDRGGVAQDDIRENNEGVRFEPPPELRAKFNAFRSSATRNRTNGGGQPRSGSAPGPSAR